MFSFWYRIFSFLFAPQVQTHYVDDVEEIRPATAGSSGYDLRAYLKENIVIHPGQIKLIPTGLVLSMPKGLEAQVRSRSGLALKHGIYVLNSPGTIDSDYRGTVGVILTNVSVESYTVKNGDRIAQLVFSRVSHPRFWVSKTIARVVRQETVPVDPTTGKPIEKKEDKKEEKPNKEDKPKQKDNKPKERGTGGFGSTGKD